MHVRSHQSYLVVRVDLQRQSYGLGTRQSSGGVHIFLSSLENRNIADVHRIVQMIVIARPHH